AKWEETALDNHVKWTTLEPTQAKSTGGASLTVMPDKSVLAGGANPDTDTYTVTIDRPSAGKGAAKITAIRIEAIADKSFAAKGPGRSGNGNAVLTDVRVRQGNGPTLRFKRATADFSQNEYGVELAIDDKPNTGWAFFPEVGK